MTADEILCVYLFACIFFSSFALYVLYKLDV